MSEREPIRIHPEIQHKVKNDPHVVISERLYFQRGRFIIKGDRLSPYQGREGDQR